MLFQVCKRVTERCKEQRLVVLKSSFISEKLLERLNFWNMTIECTDDVEQIRYF